MLLARVRETNPAYTAATLLASHSAHHARHGGPPDWDGGLQLGLI